MYSNTTSPISAERSNESLFGFGSFPMSMVPESVKIGLNFQKKSPKTQSLLTTGNFQSTTSTTSTSSTTIPPTIKQVFDSFVNRKLPPLINDDFDDSDDEMPPLIDESDDEIDIGTYLPKSKSMILGSIVDFEPKLSPNDDKFINASKKHYDMDQRPLVNNLSEHPIFYTEDGFVETDISISGKKAKEIFNGVPLVKLTNGSCVHNGMKFVEGCNVDRNVFDPTRTCGPDGLYFCKQDDIMMWLDYGYDSMVYMWDVELPDDARVVIYDDKLKSDKFILSNKKPISHHLYIKIMGMIEEDTKSQVVFDFINELPSAIIPSDDMQMIYQTILNHDPSSIQFLPEDMFTYEVCLYAAKNYTCAYEYIKNHYLSHEILFECVKKNNILYCDLPDGYISTEMSQWMFRQDVYNYELLPDEHKTLDMTIKYLTECSPLGPRRNPEINDYVPYKFENHPEVILKMIHNNGMHLQNLNYFEKTDIICRLAIKSNGMAIEFVPLPLVDFYMCYDAVNENVQAYQFVPDCFRNQELKEMMIKKSPSLINTLPICDITRDMIMSVLLDDLNILQFLPNNQHIKNLFANNMCDFIDECADLYMYVPKEYFSYDHALYMIAINPKAFNSFRFLGSKFTLDCVKNSKLHFKHIPTQSVTCKLLKELVLCRGSIINELPDRFLFPELYEICIKEHWMKHNAVPKQFLTPRIAKLQKEEEIESESEIETKIFTKTIPGNKLDLDIDPVPETLDQEYKPRSIILQIIDQESIDQPFDQEPIYHPFDQEQIPESIDQPFDQEPIGQPFDQEPIYQPFDQEQIPGSIILQIIDHIPDAINQESIDHDQELNTKEIILKEPDYHYLETETSDTVTAQSKSQSQELLPRDFHEDSMIQIADLN